MALEIYSRYYDPTTDRTVVAVHEADSSVFVRFDATLSGNLLDKTDSELLDRSITWFTARYVQEYAQQKLDEKVREFDQMIGKMQNQLALAEASRTGFTTLIMLLYGKGALTDEDLIQAGLFEVE